MHSMAGGQILQFLRRFAEIFQDLPVEEFNLAHRVQGTHHPGNGIDNQSKAFLILQERCLVGLSVFDVGVCSKPFDDPSVAVEGRSRTENKPTILSIETAQASFDFTRLARKENRSPVIRDSIQVVRVKGSRPAPITRMFGPEAGILRPELMEKVTPTFPQ